MSDSNSAKKPRKPREKKPTTKGAELLGSEGALPEEPTGYDPNQPDLPMVNRTQVYANSIYSAPITTESTDSETQEALEVLEILGRCQPANPIDSEGRTDTTEATERSTTQSDTDASGNRVGDVPLPVAAGGLVDGCQPEIIPFARVRPGETRRQCWERLRQEARAAGMTRRDSVAYAGRWAERLFPPPAPIPEPDEEPEPVQEVSAIEPPTPTPPKDVSPIGDKSEEVSGLGDLPAEWGQLPANASLQSEIAWVSANRLRVRSGSGVDLSRALSPAPSYSALSWLETSILFPSKFADISVKATAGQEDEREGIRREKLAIEEIRSLLAEMLEG